MPDRVERILRIACWTLAALVFLRLVQAGFQVGQLVGVKIPAVPTLEASSNVTAVVASSGPKVQSTNASASTNGLASMAATNAVAAEKSRGTSPVSTNTVAQAATTNHLAIPTSLVAGGTVVAATNHQPLAISSNSMAAENSIGTNSGRHQCRRTGGLHQSSRSSFHQSGGDRQPERRLYQHPGGTGINQSSGGWRRFGNQRGFYECSRPGGNQSAIGGGHKLDARRRRQTGGNQFAASLGHGRRRAAHDAGHAGGRTSAPAGDSGARG